MDKDLKIKNLFTEKQDFSKYREKNYIFFLDEEKLKKDGLNCLCIYFDRRRGSLRKKMNIEYLEKHFPNHVIKGSSSNEDYYLFIHDIETIKEIDSFLDKNYFISNEVKENFMKINEEYEEQVKKEILERVEKNFYRVMRGKFLDIRINGRVIYDTRKLLIDLCHEIMEYIITDYEEEMWLKSL